MRRPDARLSVVGKSAGRAEDDGAAVSGNEGARDPELTDDDGTQARMVCGTFLGKDGPVDGIAADPPYLDVSVPPGKRKTLPVETTRHAFAYVFAGSGKFCNASGALGGTDRKRRLARHGAAAGGRESVTRAFRQRRRSASPGGR